MGKLAKQELGEIILTMMIKISVKEIRSGEDIKKFLTQTAEEKQIEYQDLAEIVDYSMDNIIATTR